MDADPTVDRRQAPRVSDEPDFLELVTRRERGKLKLYIGSADLMGRNLDRRVEVLVPIHDPELLDELEGLRDRGPSESSGGSGRSGSGDDQ